MFSASREKEAKGKKLTAALSWCLDFFFRGSSCAREMEAKLDQTQTEKNREKNREHFSLERIKTAGEQQQEFGDEQKHKSH